MSSSLPESGPALFTAERARLSDEALLARLVGFDSTSAHSNLPIADFIADYLDLPGIRTTRNPSPDGTKTNLVVEVGPATDPDRRDGLVLSGHMDVVPATEPDWQSDPFELLALDDRLVGRGACDMKGFVALAINTAARLRPDALAAPLALVITYDEEVGTLGAHQFAHTWPDDHPLPRRAIIGEPTSLRAVRLHKGHARGVVEIGGTPAHSGYPHLGHSAIEPLGRAIVALGELGRELREERPEQSEHFPEVPFVALNLAIVEGGSAINIVPERARLEIGYRILPGMDSAQIDERVRRCLARALDGEDWRYEPGSTSPPMLLDEEHDLHQAVCRLAGQEETVSASYATDAGWFDRVGFDCLLYGPGDIGVAHKPNEWLPRAELERCARDLETLVDHYCTRPLASPSR